MQRLQPLVLWVVATGGDALVEEREVTDEKNLPVSYPIGPACGLVYSWFKDGKAFQDPRTGQDGGMRLEVPHARSADAGSYVCMLTHAPSSSNSFGTDGDRRRPERILSEPAVVVVADVDIGTTELDASNGCRPHPPELVHAPLMPLSPRMRRDGK